MLTIKNASLSAGRNKLRHLTCKQGIRLYKCYFALQNACWAVPKPHLFCIVPMQAARLFQTLLRRRHFLRRQDLKQSPSFPAAFPASPSPPPESGGALRMNTIPVAGDVPRYVGDNMMLHCGDPIFYTNLNTSYWQSHFYAYARPP